MNVERTNSVVVLILSIGLLVSIFFNARQSQQFTGLKSDFDSVKSIVELFDSNYRDAIRKQEERDLVHQEEINTLNNVINQLVGEIEIQTEKTVEANQKIESLLAELEPRPETPPEDLEECLQRLELAYQREDTLKEVIDTQTEKITSLESINLNKGLINQQKDLIIDIKDEQIEEWKQAAESARRWGNIKAGAAAVAVYVIMTLL